MAPNSSDKERLDVLMVLRGLAESREQAKRLILAGEVEIDGMDLLKPGRVIAADTPIRIKQKERYVSRGGLKLEAALREFSISIRDKVCVDVGASTGGFTDCMLQHKASRVYSVDVGISQMHERIKTDGRVVLMEHTNARHLSADNFEPRPAFAAVDVSFISILRVTKPLLRVLEPFGSAAFLIKPQFEAGKQAVSRGRGVIRDAEIHRQVLVSTLDQLIEQGWYPVGLIPSPISGGSGNIEFLCFAKISCNDAKTDVHIDIDEAIRSAGATVQ